MLVHSNFLVENRRFSFLTTCLAASPRLAAIILMLQQMAAHYAVAIIPVRPYLATISSTSGHLFG